MLQFEEDSEIRSGEMSKEQWNKSFSDERYVYGEIANEFIQENAHLFPKNSHIACFAEGEGRNAVYLAEKGYEVTAIDQSDIGLEKARQLAEARHVSIHTAEMDLTKDQTKADEYDGALMIFGHVPRQDQQFLFENIFNSVKKDGYVMIEVYSDQQLNYGTGGPPVESLLYRTKDILDWTKDYHCKHYFCGELERHEGIRHTGKAHVIQIIIQK